MNVTSKSRYALQIMLDLAKSKKGILRKRNQLSEKHKISPNYMNKIILGLKSSGLIEGCRGSCGGLRLLRPACGISVWDVVAAVEDRMSPVACVHDIKSCSIYESCLSKDVWRSMFSDVKASFESRKLSSFLDS